MLRPKQSKHALLARRDNRRQMRRRLLNALAMASVGLSTMIVTGSGCTRPAYRAKTNAEAYYLMDQKVAESGERTAPYRIEVNPCSRFFDPFNPDRPPMPEDDPVSNQYMRMVDSKRGYPLWEANGRTNTAENPQWWNYLPLDERGVLVLSLDDSVRTALLHSPAFQQNLETLYLSALDVSSERFLLDSQFFGGYSVIGVTDGPRRNGGTNSSSTITGALNSNGRRPLAMQRRFATGADLVVGLANSITWQVSGPNNQSASTLLDFSLVQPLLRQAGRDVILERLTLAERTLLANVRAMERYRRGFYMQVVTGRQPEQGPQRRGGLFGGAGLEGFTALGGGFGRVGTTNAQGGFTDTGTPGAGGYLGLLQQQTQIENFEENVARLRENLFRLEDTYRELLMTIPLSQDVIPTQQLQVAQARQAVFTAQNQLITQQSQYEQVLDTFKRTMGLPSYLCVEIRDPLLDRFKLISPALKARRVELANLRDQIGETNTRILNQTTLLRDPQTGALSRVIQQNESLSQELTTLGQDVAPMRDVHSQIIAYDIPMVAEDIQKLRAAIPERRRQLARLRDIADREKGMVCRLLPLPQFDLSLLRDDELVALPDQLVIELDKLTNRFASYEQRIVELQQRIAAYASGVQSPNDEERFRMLSQEVLLASQDLIATMAEDLLALQLVQARARTETALLQEVDIEPREAIDIARRNRQDWLNNRAALVNSWRAIEVVADDLEATLDIVFSGDLQNVGDNPLALRSSTGRLRAGLLWDAPITRLQERNRYRQSLIEYQQAKRSYYQYEDTVWTNLRTALRTIRLNQYNFELQRYAVRGAALQISINEDLRQIRETLSQASGPTAARDAVSALSDLVNAQNLFVGVWVNYEALRRNLDLDLGTMQIDSEGLWIDPGPIRLDTVGGGLGAAITNYGLTDEEICLQQQLNEAAAGGVPVEAQPTQPVPPASSIVPAPGNAPQGSVPQAVAPPGAIPQGAIPQGAIPQGVVPQAETSSRRGLNLAPPAATSIGAQPGKSALYRAPTQQSEPTNWLRSGAAPVQAAAFAMPTAAASSAATAPTAVAPAAVSPASNSRTVSTRPTTLTPPAQP